MQVVVFYSEDAEGDETGEGAGDNGGAVEDGQAESDIELG